MQWLHWKHGPRRYAELRKRGAWAEWAAKAASSAHGPGRLSHAKAVKIALPDKFFASLGLPRLVVTERLNPPNRRMRTRMSGGGRGARVTAPPMPFSQPERVMENKASNIPDDAPGTKCMVCRERARFFLIESRYRHASMFPACLWRSLSPGLDGSRAHLSS